TQKDYRFIFLTLTCKNVYGENLSDQLDELFKAFNLLTKRKTVKQAVKGWFRALEVTHNLDEASKDYDTFHPHFHIILMVNKSYFNKPELYISQEKWTSLWKSCLKVDYTPIIDVRAFKTGKSSHVSKSVAESAKYAVKSNDFIIRDKDGVIDEEMTDDSVFILDKALANRRLVAFGGELKEIHKLLNLDDTENGDLINTDNEELREDLDYIIERYKWHIGYKQYYKID
ncbi:protein rep, partial [Alkaliphilus sp. MSJ-5]